jgi:hypothetical protein
LPSTRESHVPSVLGEKRWKGFVAGLAHGCSFSALLPSDAIVPFTVRHIDESERVK